MKWLLVLLGFICLCACTRRSAEADDPCKTELSYKYAIDRKVDTIRYNGTLQLESKIGDTLVFKYTYAYNCNYIADEGYTEELLFEVPTNVNSFSYTNGTLVDANTWYILKCYCAGVGARRVVHGTIKGQKTNSGWKVEVDVEGPVFASVKAVKFNETFTLQ